LLPIHDENRPTRKPYVNYGLIAANVVIFFLFFLQGTRALVGGIFEYGAIPDDIVTGGRLWTLFTSMFMHADLMHLLGNMVYLWVFGDNIEDALGHFKYFAFYVLGGLAASFTHIVSLYVTLPSLGYADFSIPAVGASGAISAVLGAYILLYPRAKVRTIVFYFLISIVSIPAFYYLGFWFLYQLMLGFVSLTGLTSGVAFWAHIGGFVAGVAAIKLLRVKRLPQVVKASIQRPFQPIVVGRKTVRQPFVDVIQEGDRLKVYAELPGVEEKDIRIRVSEGEVAISAEHGELNYRRQIPLPGRVYPQIRELSFRNGVLSFSLNRKS